MEALSINKTNILTNNFYALKKNKRIIKSI